MNAEWCRRLSSSWLSFSVVASTTICVVIVLLGCGYNNLGLKYIRKTQAIAPNSQCNKELFIANVKDSQLCCDAYNHDMDWVCVAAFDKVNRFLSSNAALYVPLLPFVITCITDAIRVFCDRSFASTALSYVKSHLSRAVLYATIIAYRTFVLYLGGDYIQRYAQQGESAPQTCWYSHLIRSGRCKDNFDYSDHIVLYVVQYIFIAVIELTYIIIQRSLKPTTLTKPLSVSASIGHLLVALTSFAIVYYSLRGILFTCMYFHTVAENLVAVMIAALFAAVPLILYANSNSWYSIAAGALKEIEE